ncbi:hypothetical protein [Pseudothermotoga sp.]
MIVQDEQMLKSIYELKKRLKEAKHESGSKAGRSIADHLTNVAFTSYLLARYLYSRNVLDDRHVTLAFYAGLLHDMNKILSRSLRQSSSLEEIKEVLNSLGVSESDLFVQENLQIIQMCVSLHQETGLVGMELLFNREEKFDKKVKILTKVIKFADKFDNFTSADLEKDRRLKESCESVLREIQTVSDGKFDRTALFHVVLKEYRGMLTELIFEVLNDLLIEKHDLFPIARFPNGLVYLSKGDQREEPLEHLICELSRRFLDHEGIARAIFEDSVTFESTGVRLSSSAFEMELNRLIDKLLMISISKKDKYNERAIFIEGLQRICDELYKNGGSHRDSIKEKFKLLAGFNLDKKSTGQMRYETISRLSPFVNSSESLEDFAKRCVSELTDLYKKCSKRNLKTYLERYLTMNLSVCGYNIAEQYTKEFVRSFHRYGPYKHTCSICSTSGKHEVVEAESAETPSLKVQMFTNRGPAHKRMDPKRHICQYCRLQFLATKAKGLNYSDSQIVFVLLPENYYPDSFLRTMEEQVKKELNGTSNESSQSAMSDVIVSLFKRGKKKEQLKIIFGNMVYLPIPVSRNDLKKWKSLSAMAAISALRIRYRIPVRVLVTTDVQLLQDDIEFDENIWVKDAGVFAKKILLNPGVWRQFGEYLRDTNVRDYLFEFLSQPTDLDVAAVIAKRWEDFKPMTIVPCLFKIFGGDRVEEIRKMAELARRWALEGSSESKVTEYQYTKPFLNAIKSVRKFDPKTEDEEVLEALIFESVSRSTDSQNEAKEFADAFLSFLKRIGEGNLINGRETLIFNYAKYRNLFLGTIKLLIYESRTSKKSKEV